MAGSSSTTPSCELSDSSSLTTSPLRSSCRHSHAHYSHHHGHTSRRRSHRSNRSNHRHSRRRPHHHEPSVSSVSTSVADQSAYQYSTSRSRHRAAGVGAGGSSGRRMRRRPRRKVSFRSDLDECATAHCPQCGSRQRAGSSHRQQHIMRRNTFATAASATAAVQQRTLVATYSSRVEPVASNTIGSSTSSSGCHKTNSNHSSEFYPRVGELTNIIYMANKRYVLECSLRL